MGLRIQSTHIFLLNSRNHFMNSNKFQELDMRDYVISLSDNGFQKGQVDIKLFRKTLNKEILNF